MRRTLVVLSLLVLSLPASAQEDRTRPAGAVFAALQLGAGWGQAYVDASGTTVAETDAQLGAVWGFRIGSALSEILSLSVDYSGYSSVDDEPSSFDKVESETWLIGPALTWYPAAGRFYMKGTVGWGGAEFRVVDGDQAARAKDEGLGLSAGIGYEIPLNERLSFGGQVDYVWMNVGEVRVNDGIGGTEDADFDFASWGFTAFLMMYY